MCPLGIKIPQSINFLYFSQNLFYGAKTVQAIRFQFGTREVEDMSSSSGSCLGPVGAVFLPTGWRADMQGWRGASINARPFGALVLLCDTSASACWGGRWRLNSHITAQIWTSTIADLMSLLSQYFVPSEWGKVIYEHLLKYYTQGRFWSTCTCILCCLIPVLHYSSSYESVVID